MQRKNCSTDVTECLRRGLRLLLAAVLLAPLPALAGNAMLGERLDGFYSREGNDGSPAATAGNNIYLKFFDDRWVALLS